MVLLVHGGPWARDSWGYQPDVQLLANRGYAVLQVNFRGSTGYGKAFVKAAIGEFAGKMHDDLIDAVDWAVRAGLRGPGPRRDLRRLLRRLRHPGRRHLHPRRLRRRDRLRRHLEPRELHADPTADRQAPLGQQLAPVRRRPFRSGAGGRHAGPLADHPGGPDPHTAAGGPGRQRHRASCRPSPTISSRRCARGASRSSTWSRTTKATAFVNPDNQIDMYRAVERFLARHLGGRRIDR